MMAGGRLARWDVYRRGIATTRGIQVGDSEPKVRRRYPGIHVRRHFYVPRTGHYLTYKPAGQPGRRIRFETDHGRVIYFYGGRLPQVLFIEGCA